MGEKCHCFDVETQRVGPLAWHQAQEAQEEEEDKRAFPPQKYLPLLQKLRGFKSIKLLLWPCFIFCIKHKEA